jgi:hypothetical protein
MPMGVDDIYAWPPFVTLPHFARKTITWKNAKRKQLYIIADYLFSCPVYLRHTYLEYIFLLTTVTSTHIP